ncbi:hypothetical protein B0H63DRAFT_464720 [Podospora didyma]|uniref:NAD-dependent epimerase/dehydratase domain-containing protein n=1 Tax=Podospora didyma TaxID=330526 RepID=A0AAE0NYP2_9PEZI|nr:hypothetical protein B0H63DRAFT_464720 [Podospora didyma]
MSSKGLVLVTGANGYIAARTVEAFLKAGYSVRGTVRSKSSSGANDLVTALSSYSSNFSLVEVPDITTPGAFDNAVKGVDAIAHLAAPVALNFTDPEPVMKGAIDGILRILESANKEPSVKSFVFMSSIVAVIGGIGSSKEGDYTFTEKDWNTQAEAIVAEQGKNAPGPVIYSASKTAAEKTLWKFRDEHKPNFTITAINPTFVAGPPLVVPSSTKEINITNTLIPDVYAGKPLDEAGLGAHVSHAYVDIRDVARLTVFGVEHPEKADGERFILASFYSPAQAVADILRKQYPERADVIKEGTPGVGYLPGYAYPSKAVYDGTKATRTTGQDYIPWEQTVRDTVEKLKPLL